MYMCVNILFFLILFIYIFWTYWMYNCIILCQFQYCQYEIENEESKNPINLIHKFVQDFTPTSARMTPTCHPKV